MPKKGDEPDALYLCPNCGAFMSSSADKCPQCGAAAADDGSESEDAPAEPTTADVASQAADSQRDGASDSIFMCPGCGAFIASSAAKCPQCGAEVGDVDGGPEPDAAESTMAPTATPSVEPDAQVLNMCLACGAFSASSSGMCPSCGHDMTETSEPSRPVLPKEDVELLNMLVSSDDSAGRDAHLKGMDLPPRPDAIGICGVCGAFVMPGFERCGVCATLLTEETVRYPDETEVLPEVRPYSADPAGIVKGALGIGGTPELDAPAADVETSLDVCTVCGAFMQKGGARCPVCNTESSQMPAYAPLDVGAQSGPSDRSLTVCPKCGSFVREGEARCGKCGSTMPENLPVVALKERDTLSEAENVIVRMLGAVPDAAKSDSDQAGSQLDICSNCGAFMASTSSKCPMCGTGAGGDVDDLFRMLKSEGDDAVAGTGSEECPFCGARVSPKSPACGECGFVFAPESAIPDADSEIASIESELETVDFMANGLLEDARPPTSARKSKDSIVEDKRLDSFEKAEPDPLIEMLEFEAKPSPGKAPETPDADDETSELDDLEKMLVSEEPTVPQDATRELNKNAEQSPEGRGQQKAATPEDLELSLVDEIVSAGLADMKAVVEPVNDEPKAVELSPRLPGIDQEVLAVVEDLESEIGADVQSETKPAGAEAAEDDGVVLDLESELNALENEGPRTEGTYDRLKMVEDGESIAIAQELVEDIGKGEEDSEGGLAEGLDAEMVTTVDGSSEDSDAVKEGPSRDGGEIDDGSAAAESPSDSVDMPYAETGTETDGVPEGMETPVAHRSDEDDGATYESPEPAEVGYDSGLDGAAEAEAAGTGDVPAQPDDGGIPAWRDPELLDQLILYSGFMLCLYLLTSFLFPATMQVVIIACFQPIVVAAYALSHAVGGMAALERSSRKWVAPVALSMAFFPAAAAAGTDASYVPISLLAAASVAIIVGARASPKGWRKRAMWAASASPLLTFAGLKLLDSGGFMMQAMLAVSMALLAAACFESLSDYSARKTLDIAIARGDARYSRNDYAKAAMAYDDAIVQMRKGRGRGEGARATGYDLPWSRKGLALVLSGDVKGGIKCLQMALRLNPDNPMTWMNLGNALTKDGRHEEAVAAFDKAISLDPKQEVAWNNRGNALARQGRYIEALKSYNSAIKLNPRYHDVWVNKGYVLAKMGKYDEAARCVSSIKSAPAVSGA
jgi:tetratricopeptide (TPR) repeat protein/RNA polymerase subunit RPABC4/transcription elongation factor Spt4